jgi:predicted GH43/DUF377 family glycosyl hydrolase
VSLRVTHQRIVSRGDIPGSNGGVYNPGAVLSGSTIFMLCRREVDYRFTPLVFPESLTLDPDTLSIVGRRTLKKGAYPEGSRIEDFRCIRFDDMLLVAHCLVESARIKPAISRIVEDRIEPWDDFNLPISAARVEKNWVLFERRGELHCLYKLDPLTIFVRRNSGWHLIKEEENGWADEFPRMLSNSTNLIPFLDGHLGFWHTILDGRYVQGAFLLGRDLKIRYKTGALLDGAAVREGYKPGVLYVSSLVEHAGRILAFYGEGDSHTSVAIFDAEELARTLQRSPPKFSVPLYIRYHGGSMGDLFRALIAVRQFSAAREAPPIRLYVSDMRLCPVVEVFKIPNLTVHERERQRPYDYAVFGQTGTILAPEAIAHDRSQP